MLRHTIMSCCFFYCIVKFVFPFKIVCTSLFLLPLSSRRSHPSQTSRQQETVCVCCWTAGDRALGSWEYIPSLHVYVCNYSNVELC